MVATIQEFFDSVNSGVTAASGTLSNLVSSAGGIVSNLNQVATNIKNFNSNPSDATSDNSTPLKNVTSEKALMYAGIGIAVIAAIALIKD